MATASISHFSEEKENYLRINLLWTEISPKAVRVFFNKTFPPTCLYTTIEKESNRLNDLKKEHLINSSQWSLLFPSNGVPDSKNFDVILMITLIRNLMSLPTPVSGYDQLPLSTDTTPTDDLTRIEYYKTKLANFEDGQMGSSDFFTAWEDMIGAIGRLGGRDMFAECEELRTKQLCHSTQDLEKRITHIVEDDNETIERYSRVSRVIIDTFPNILRDIIRSIIAASKLYQMCNQHLRSFSTYQIAALHDLKSSSSYDSMDITLIYKLLRYFSLINAPTNGWGGKPDEVDITLADDVERIRRYRNYFAHRCNTNIGTDEFDDYFDKFRDIGSRMDQHFFQMTNYERLIISHKTCTMDMDMQTKYSKALAELEYIKLRFEKKPIKFYWGDNFDVMHLKSLLNQEKEEGKENINVQIVFQNKEDIEKCKTILKALQEEENMDISRVDFIFAEEGMRKKLDMQLPWLVDADEFQRMLSDGEYLSYENRLSLGGPCRVGKSALASVLIGTEIPQTWNSTNGLVIYFGRNGIDIEKKKMVPLKEEKRGDDVLAKILRGQPNVQKKSEQITRQKTTTHDFRAKHAVDEFAIQTCTSINGSVLEHTHKRMLDRTRYSAIDEMQLSKRPKLELKSDILEEVRKGQYRIKIAPSDLIDFGGQKSYDMTHQLFIQHSGSFLLMFDGRFGLYDQLNEYPLGVTAASILIHWVDSILTYSEDTEDIMPMILFAATHRDLCQGDTAKMKESFISAIKHIFSKHDKKSHIHLDTVYFINSKDEHDQEIQHMTDQVVTFAMKQSSWGQRRPMQWVPLELEISNIRMKNVNIITKEDLRTVNMLNDDLALTDNQLDVFLLVQHSLGKLIYYNIPRLDNFVIIHPPVLVNILRSFVTDEMFFPEEENLKSILQTLTEIGKIYKTDLLKLWDKNEYIQNDAIKEFVIELLVHLNILIIPETYKSNRSSAELFIVPCMIKTIKPSNYIDLENQREKTICLKYVLSRQSIPSSLAYTIIGTTLHVWPFKEEGTEGNMSCIYHKAVVLNVIDNNELRLWVEDNMIKVYITNQTSLLAISPDITASIQECLTRNLKSTLEFFYKSFGGQLKHAKLSELFSMEVGIPCGSSVCYLPLEKAKTVESWKCENGEEHMTRNLLYWIFDRVPETCKPECKGKTNEELKIEPSDKHLARFGNFFGYKSFEDYFIHLGMKKLTLKKIEDKYHVFGSGGIISIALIQWRESKLSGMEKPTMKSLSDALVASELDSHLMCQIFREDTKLLDDANPNLQKTPTDKALINLSKQIGNCVFELGIELGLRVAEIEQISFKNYQNLPRLIEEILLKWKRTSKVKTVRNLLMALERVEKGGYNCLSNMLKDKTMFEEKDCSKDFSDCYKKTKNQTGLALIVNYSINRKGSDEDVRRLENFFLKELRYKVKCEHNLKKSDLMDTIDSLKTNEMTGKSGTRYHCFVLVIMCHGKEDKLRLCGEDHVKVKEIVDKFKLTDFAGKPKFFIFQACREGLEQSYRHAPDDPDTSGQLQSDYKPLSEKLHPDSDILLSFATTPGYEAYRKVPHEENQWIGSWFIHALLDVFEKKYKDKDVMKMLEEVRRNLNSKADYRPQDGKCQMSEDVSTLTKTFFF